MQIIDSSYFGGELHIAQLAQRAVQEVVDEFIVKYQAQYLKEMLGYALYKAFKTGMEEAEPVQNWKDLIEGAEYTDCNGRTQYWEGFKNDELVSPIANYVYFYYTRDNAIQTTANGDKAESVQGMVNTGPALKQTRAWNEMVDMNWRLNDFLLNKKVDGALVYPEYCGFRWCDMFNKINVFGL